MSFVTLLSMLLAMLVGFAAHRASLCSVKAVAEVLTSGTGYMLRSFAKAAAWAAAVSGTLLLVTSAPLPSFWNTGQYWSLPLLSFLWLWALWEIAWHAIAHNAATGIRQRLSAPIYRLSSAAAVLGIAGGLLYNLQGAWTYTNFLRTEAVSWLIAAPGPTLGHGVLLAALTAGMWLSSLQRGSFALQRDGHRHLRRRVTGGLLMGVGGALIPGGNDTLLLGAIPTLSPWAVGTYLALLAGIALALMVMRRLAGSLPRVECAGDKCA